MKRRLILVCSAAAASLTFTPAAQANDANTVFSGISAATGVISVFQQSNTNRHLNNIQQNQEERMCYECLRDQAVAKRAAANRRAAANKAASDKRAAEQARLEAAQAKASADASRRRRLDALKYD